MTEEIKIGEYTISKREVEQFIDTLSSEQQMYRNVPDFRLQVEERLVEIALFAMDATENNLEATEDYKFAMSIAKRDILGQLAMAKAIGNVEVNEEELKEYYDSNRSQFGTGESVMAKHILMDSEDELKKIMKDIADGNKTFEDAAKEFSTCPSGKSGGSLGNFGRGQMVKEFEDAAFNAEIGKVIGPVKTQFGYHLILVEEKTEAKIKSFDEVKSQVEKLVLKKKQQNIYDNKISELKKKYNI